MSISSINSKSSEDYNRGLQMILDGTEELENMTNVFAVENCRLELEINVHKTKYRMQKYGKKLDEAQDDVSCFIAGRKYTRCKKKFKKARARLEEFNKNMGCRGSREGRDEE